MDNILYYYWLSTVEGLGSKKIENIIQYFGSPQNAYYAAPELYRHIDGISFKIADRIIERREKSKLKSELASIYKKGIKVISFDDEMYPKRLKEIYDPPYILYVKGTIKNNVKNIGIVGARNCTPYGRMVSRTISKELARYDIGIISGMARGIDTEAHKGALDCLGYTCAVLGCGLDIAYPPENNKLMQKIEDSGAVISEYPLGTLPSAFNFPKRNRIISGMSDIIIIVEAGEKSGALITTDLALEQGRDVYAVPGNILSKASKGTNNLIKEGAQPLLDIEDILNDLGIDKKTESTAENNVILEEKEKQLSDIISDCPIYIDDLIKKVSFRVGEINALLTTLELKGVIRILPGRYIVKQNN